MTTRHRAGPRSMAAIFAFTAILAATMLIAVTPASAAATTQTKLQQFNEAPAISLKAATAVTVDFGLAPEAASPPAATWMNVTDAAAAVPNVLFGTNYLAASSSTRAAPINMAAANTVMNSTVAKKNLVLGAANDFKKQFDAVNYVKTVSKDLGRAVRAAPLVAQNNMSVTYSAATNVANDFKTNFVFGVALGTPATIDAKKTSSNGADTGG